ncbi:KpsF/GutQ family sugar-phosphate isomerase [Roseibacillus ishigakijimensis]|uniref:KpsF/GutQ family sugar-phosphate isomerase n=1 Tax=Roseibacillus ishigakijimensis TaxID=454146 RepID=A0A934RSM8_9BACT|nr:KpsF/GutQ family sugar-phosphate isomerase [Roseibacillus ishigakijimensis]MBK1833490.1 KpsF/GutQ family sugar-phosphate isomerase [Roseibacillus ishigakijimensis]
MSDHLTTARQVIRLESEALQAFEKRLDSSFNDAIDSLLAVLSEGKKIVLVGIGKSGNIAHKIAATLTSTGSPAVVLHSQNALHGDLGLLAEGDAVIALSYSGETNELLNLLPYLKRRSGTLLALTGKKQSTLAVHADHLLDTSVPREACPLELAPTSSSTTMLVAGDALAMALMSARGFTAEDFAQFHPGGSLGRALLTTVGDIMRTGERLAIVAPDNTVFEALNAMTRAKSGAAVILNADRTLAGIFTHGDFARSFQTRPDIGARPVSTLMTPRPITIAATALAAEAVRLVAERNIDDLIVLAADSTEVLGLVDSQDLASLKLT